MTDVASRELRNNTRSLLDRVEAGEDLRITVDGRPVALLISANRRSTSMPRARFARLLAGQQTDPALRQELRELAPDTTEDLP